VQRRAMRRGRLQKFKVFTHKRTCWRRGMRRDLRRDVTKRRLREDLVGDLPKLA
jgi:endonuclease I